MDFSPSFWKNLPFSLCGKELLQILKKGHVSREAHCFYMNCILTLMYLKIQIHDEVVFDLPLQYRSWNVKAKWIIGIKISKQNCCISYCWCNKSFQTTDDSTYTLNILSPDFLMKNTLERNLSVHICMCVRSVWSREKPQSGIMEKTLKFGCKNHYLSPGKHFRISWYPAQDFTKDNAKGKHIYLQDEER